VNIVAMALGLLFVIVTGLAYWTYVFWPLIKRNRKLNELGEWRATLMQVPLVLSVAMVGLGYYEFIVFPFSPPTSLVSIFGDTLQYAQFLYPIMFCSFLLSATAYYFFKALSPAHKYWAPSVATLILIGAFFGIADFQTTRLQAIAIKNEKFDSVSIKSFWFRAQHTRYRSEIDINTVGVKGNTKYLWSFATLDFHEQH
jgi:hypothetical protein